MITFKVGERELKVGDSLIEKYPALNQLLKKKGGKCFSIGYYSFEEVEDVILFMRGELDYQELSNNSKRLFDLLTETSTTPPNEIIRSIFETIPGRYLDDLVGIHASVEDLIQESVKDNIYEVVKQGNMRAYSYITHSKECDWNKLIEIASIQANETMIKNLIEKSDIEYVDWEAAALAAAKAGNIKLFDYFSSKLVGDEGIEEFWYSAFEMAAGSGNLELVKFIDDDIPKDDVSFYGNGLFAACEKGHLAIVKMMIEKGANDLSAGDFSAAFNLACKGGNLEIIRLIYDKIGDKTEIDISQALFDACEGGHIEAINELINKFTEIGGKDWDSGLRGASSGGHLAIVKMMIEKGATGFNSALNFAVLDGNKNVFDFLIDKIDPDKSLNIPFRKACVGGNLEIVQALIDRGADDWNGGVKSLYSGLDEGLQVGEIYHRDHVEILKLLIGKGADKGIVKGNKIPHRELLEYLHEEQGVNVFDVTRILDRSKYWFLIKYAFMNGNYKDYEKVRAKELRKLKSNEEFKTITEDFSPFYRGRLIEAYETKGF